MLLESLLIAVSRIAKHLMTPGGLLLIEGCLLLRGVMAGGKSFLIAGVLIWVLMFMQALWLFMRPLFRGRYKL